MPRFPLAAVFVLVASCASAQNQSPSNTSPATVPVNATPPAATVQAQPRNTGTQRVVIDQVPVLDVKRDWVDIWQLMLTLALLVLTVGQLFFSFMNAKAAEINAKAAAEAASSAAAQLRLFYAPVFEVRDAHIRRLVRPDATEMEVARVGIDIHNIGAAPVRFKEIHATFVAEHGTQFHDQRLPLGTVGVDRRHQVDMLIGKFEAVDIDHLKKGTLRLKVEITFSIFDPLTNNVSKYPMTRWIHAEKNDPIEIFG